MKKFIAERGLMISLDDLYEDVQSVLISNLTAYVKSIIYEPGLRIAEGDEFLVQQDGANIIADAGAIVFPNYDLWVPPSTGAQLSADISFLEVDAESNKNLAIYVILETEETHPQRQALDSDLFYTVQRNVVKMIVCEGITVPPAQSFLLSFATLTPEHKLILEDRRFDSVLKLVSRYDVLEWEPRISVFPPVSDVTVSVIRQADYRQSVCKGQSINTQSLPTDQLGGYHLNVSWVAPSLEEIEALHGVAYYKVVATPITSIEYDDANISQIVLVSKGEIEEKTISQRVGCMIPCDLGIQYNVRVYRVSNILNLRVGNATDPVSKTIGPDSTMSSQIMEVDIAYAFSTRDIISIQCSYDGNSGDTMRVYAREYSGSTHSTEDVSQWKYLIHEGPVGEVFYKTMDLSNDGLSVYVVIIGRRHNNVVSETEHFGYDEYKTPWENIYSVVVQEAGGGWAGRAASSATGAGTAVDLDGNGSAIVTVTVGHNRKIGDYIYFLNSTLHGAGAGGFINGWHEVKGTEDTSLIFDESNPVGAAAGTCDLMGNSIFTETTPVGVEHNAGAHFADRFARGHEIIITNSSDGANLPDGSYNVRDINDGYWNYGASLANSKFTIDKELAWLGGFIYGDITFPTPNTVHSFELKNDAYISMIVTGIRSGARVGEDGHPACIMTVTDGITDHVLSIPQSGVRKKDFNLDYIQAGTNIDVKLERTSNDDRFNLSSLIVFIYLQYRL